METSNDFLVEQSEILDFIDENFPFIRPGRLSHVKALAKFGEINSRIWDLVDLGHNFDLSDSEYASNARETVRLNDLRANLIDGINKTAGLERREKL